MAACGYDVRIGTPTRVDQETVYLSWNRYSEWHDTCTRVELAGGRAIVAENGYIGGRLDGGDYYALALGAHNGRGKWPVGGRERWDALGIELKPWRTSGGHVLVAANRSFGQPGGVMPPCWPRDVKTRLEKLTQREVRIRPHPGNNKPQIPLERDFENCWAVCIWSSSVGVKALIAGVPVISESPFWICKGAADRNIECVEKIDDRGGLLTREEALQRLAWGQWNLTEISSGEAFRQLLQ